MACFFVEGSFLWLWALRAYLLLRSRVHSHNFQWTKTVKTTRAYAIGLISPWRMVGSMWTQTLLNDVDDAKTESLYFIRCHVWPSMRSDLPQNVLVILSVISGAVTHSFMHLVNRVRFQRSEDAVMLWPCFYFYSIMSRIMGLQFFGGFFGKGINSLLPGSSSSLDDLWSSWISRVAFALTPAAVLCSHHCSSTWRDFALFCLISSP